MKTITVEIEDKRHRLHRDGESLPHMLLPLAQLPSSCTLRLKGLGDDDYDEFWLLANAMDME